MRDKLAREQGKCFIDEVLGPNEKLITSFYQQLAEKEELKHERDAAIKEANRRDQKWKDGIDEILGEKLNWNQPLSSPDPHPSSILRKRFDQLRAEVEKLKKDITQQAIDAAIAKDKEGK